MRKLLFPAAMLMASFAGAQVVERQVIAPGGSSFVGSYAVDWTIGETVVQAATMNGTLIFQGYQQPLTTAPSGVLSPGNRLIRMYPNPATGLVHVEWDGIPGNYRLEVLSVTGALVYSDSGISGASAGLDISQFAPGSYLVQISGEHCRLHGKLLRI